MTTLTYKTGDLMEADEIAIAHGCNTQGLMGAGVARLVRDKYPDVYEAYKESCNSGVFQVGTAQAVWADPTNHGDRLVYNLGTQRFPGPDATVWGVFLSFANMAENAYWRKITTIAIPRIGCGIGALDWVSDVEPAIEKAIEWSSHPNLSIVVYDLPGAS